MTENSHGIVHLARAAVADNCCETGLVRTAAPLIEGPVVGAERLAWYTKIVAALAKVCEKVSASSDPMEPLLLLVGELTNLLGNHATAVYRYESEGRLLRLVCGHVDGRTDAELLGHPFGRADLPVPVADFPAWADLTASGRPQFLRMSPDSTAPPSNVWHVHHRHRTIVQSALMAQGRPLGLLGLAFQTDVEPDVPQLEAFAAIAQQVTLVLQQFELAQKIQRVAEIERSQALSFERERAASQRVEELGKVNSALQAAARGLVRESKLDDVLPTILQATMDAAGAPAAAVLRRVDGTTEFVYEVIIQDGVLLTGLALEEHPFALQVREVSRMDPEGYFARMVAGETVWRLADDAQAGPLNESKRWHEPRGQKAVWDIPFSVGNRVAGYLGLAFSHSDSPSESVTETVNALATQVGLAMQLKSLAESDKKAAVLSEQRQAAEARATELERTSIALQRTIDAVAELATMSDFVPRALRIVADAFGASSAGYFEHPGSTINLRYWLLNGEIYGPKELPTLDAERYAVMLQLADGFTVPPEHLGVDLHSRLRPCIIHHAVATASPPLHQFAIAMEWHWELNVPLVIGARAEGAITLYRPSGRPFTESDFAFAEGLAKQMALAMKISSLAEREREVVITRERAAELARANLALRRSQSRLAETPDVSAALEQAVTTVLEICGAFGGAIGRYSASERGFRNLFQIIGGQVLQSPGLNHDERLYSLDEPAIALAWQAFEQSDAVLWCGLDSPYLTVDTRDYMRQMGIRSTILVALKRGSDITGYLSVFSHKSEPLLPEQHELVRSLSDQIALMLELKQLSDADKQAAVLRERERAALARVAELSVANDALNRSLLTIAAEPVERAPELMLLELSRAAKAVNTYWLAFDEVANTLEVAIRIERGQILRAPPPDEPDILRKPFRADISPAFARLCDEDSTIRLSRHRDADPLFPGINEWHHRNGRTEGLAFVVRVGAKPLGLVGMAFDDREVITDVQEQLVRSLANQFVLALELTRLSEDSRRAESARAVATERLRIAAEMHDSLAQSFTSIALQSESLRSHKDEHSSAANVLRVIEQTARQGLAEVRASVLTLHSLDGPAGTLDKAMAQLAERCNVPGSIRCAFVSTGEPCAVAGDTRDSLMRIAREALNNAMRHSGGTRMRLTLAYAGGRVRIRVEDDGKGLAENGGIERRGYGLEGMARRAEMIGGTLQLLGSELGGVMVEVNLPCISPPAARKEPWA